jgi:hypothetical protein
MSGSPIKPSSSADQYALALLNSNSLSNHDSKWQDSKTQTITHALPKKWLDLDSLIGDSIGNGCNPGCDSEYVLESLSQPVKASVLLFNRTVALHVRDLDNTFRKTVRHARRLLTFFFFFFFFF